MEQKKFENKGKKCEWIMKVVFFSFAFEAGVSFIDFFLIKFVVSFKVTVIVKLNKAFYTSVKTAWLTLL